MKIEKIRLRQQEIKSIKEVVYSLDSNAKIYLFGSRVCDGKRGGDIDLLLLSDKLTNKDAIKLRLALYSKIGEQKIDIIIAKDLSKPFTRIAAAEGVLL